MYVWIYAPSAIEGEPSQHLWHTYFSLHFHHLLYFESGLILDNYRFPYSNKIPEIVNLQREKIYCGLKFWNLRPVIDGPCSLGACVSPSWWKHLPERSRSACVQTQWRREGKGLATNSESGP